MSWQSDVTGRCCSPRPDVRKSYRTCLSQSLKPFQQDQIKWLRLRVVALEGKKTRIVSMWGGVQETLAVTEAGWELADPPGCQGWCSLQHPANEHQMCCMGRNNHDIFLTADSLFPLNPNPPAPQPTHERRGQHTHTDVCAFLSLINQYLAGSNNAS